MTTQSSILAWRVTWTEESGGLQFTGLKSWTRLKRLSTAQRNLLNSITCDFDQKLVECFTFQNFS